MLYKDISILNSNVSILIHLILWQFDLIFYLFTDIDDEFRRSPKDKVEYQTKDHQFECIPPNGYPRPKVLEWRKNGKTLFKIKDDKKTKKYDNKWFFRREGKVRILSFWTQLDSAGVYTCVAGNSEGIRVSEPARLTVKGKFLFDPILTPPLWPSKSFKKEINGYPI